MKMNQKRRHQLAEGLKELFPEDDFEPIKQARFACQDELGKWLREEEKHAS